MEQKNVEQNTGYTHNKKKIRLNLEDTKQTALIGKALSSEVRLEILKLLVEKSANISEIAGIFHLPQSSAALHVKVLEEAGMIHVTSKPGMRGEQKVCGIVFEDIYLNAFAHKEDRASNKIHQISMGIGNYFDCDIKGNCGIVSEKSYLGLEDSSYGFYSENRTEAQLLWFQTGYVEYRLPLPPACNPDCMEELSFSFEICSEAPGYQNEWESDITVWVNDREVATLRSAGDFGGRRGRLNPKWWGENMTQYGRLRTVTINSEGCFEQDEKCSDYTTESLEIAGKPYISLKIGVKEDADCVGGMNLFGDKFGDHPQGIIMCVKERSEE